MIVLVGFMGSGKTTVGRLVAERLGLPFADADEVIEARAGRGIPAIFATDGEEAFRDLEEATVADLLAGPESVIALGGGALEREATRSRLAGHTVVHLDVSLEEALRRVGGDGGRPVLADPGLALRHAVRRLFADEVTGVVVAVDDRTVDEVADAVIAVLEGDRS